MLIPAQIIFIVTALAGVAWILFARSQTGRFQAKVLTWLCVPYFGSSLIYLWFSLFDVDISIRANHARLAIMTISLPQAIILIALYFVQRGVRGKSS